MNYIVIDLEWNQCPQGKEKENKKIPFEIIELGAVKLNEDLQMVDEFSQLVKPSIYLEMHHITQEITKVDMEELKKGRNFKTVIEEFFEWCGTEYMLCTWGPMDLTELQRNMEYFNVKRYLPQPLFYYDIQKFYSILSEDGKIRRTLEFVVEKLGIDKDAVFHRALSDAFYTVEVLRKLDFNEVKANYSIDYYYNPKTKEEEIHAVYPTYSKFVSREFQSKESALYDREVSSTRCFLCGKNAKRKIRWFSDNSRMYYALAHCEEHGYLKCKLRMKKTPDDKVYVVKTIKLIPPEDIGIIRKKQDEIRQKRKNKRFKRGYSE